MCACDCDKDRSRGEGIGLGFVMMVEGTPAASATHGSE
jgi:hypothetical protein